MMASLSLSRFLDCCFGMLISILFCCIPPSIGASVRNLFCLFHFFISPFGVVIGGDGHTTICPTMGGSIAHYGSGCQVGLYKIPY